MSAKVLNKTFVIINDSEIATTLMVKGGSIYADRPTNVMVQMANFHHTVAAERYGQRCVHDDKNSSSTALLSLAFT